MNYPFSVRRENELLRKEFGSEHGIARFQWIWSGDLQQPMLLINSDNEAVYDYYCDCGKNQSVHSATCKLTLRRQRWEMRSIVPDLHDQWVLCRWVPTEASHDDWQTSFPGLPYPQNGFQVPVGDPKKCLALTAGQVPYRQTTELVIRHIKEHFSKTSAERTQETKDAWAKSDKKFHDDLVIRCKDAFPVAMGWPSEKNDVSFGGLPDVASPAIRNENGNDTANAS